MTRMGKNGLEPCKCGSETWDGRAYPSGLPYPNDYFTIFTCEGCGFEVKVREDEVDDED
jgi:hypothetical protein